MRELRAIDFVNRLIDDGKLSGDEYMRTRAHRIEGGKFLAPFSASTKVKASWTMIQQLHGFGREAAKSWLAANYDMIGVESTLDLRMAYKAHGVRIGEQRDFEASAADQQQSAPAPHASGRDSASND